VQPPDGLNSSLSAPATPGGGWAPSIPHTNPNLSKTSLKDMTIRAKAGIQAGDVQKEAHMAYNLALLNENKKNLKKAIRFYKRFFFCARLLEDPVGAALALNRIGVAYHKLKKFAKSFSFHKKHLEFTDLENIYAAYYN
jgi:tetratricopeptide (TPR) repeat protein